MIRAVNFFVEAQSFFVLRERLRRVAMFERERAEIVERERHVCALRAVEFFVDGACALGERQAAFGLTRGAVERGEVAERGGDETVFKAELLLEDRARAQE